MVTVAKSELVLHAHSCGSHARIHSHTYINSVTTTLSEVPSQLLQILESNFYFKGPWGRGSRPEYPEKTPDSLPANRYHILKEKIQCPRRDSNPHPPTFVISSPGQDCTRHLTHWATDRCCNTPPPTPDCGYKGLKMCYEPGRSSQHLYVM